MNPFPLPNAIAGAGMNISVTGLHFSYPSGVAALAGADLTVTAGDTLALVGENGAGKTTLVKHLNGLLRPSAGRVLVGDWDTREHTVAELSARVGYVFQNPDDQLFARTVEAEVAFGPRNLGRPTGEVEAAVAAALASVGLAEHRADHPYDLYLSQRKLLAIAAVLAMRTPVVVLDEPTTGQDARGVARMGDLVDSLREAGRTVIAISHDIDFCAEHFSRTAVMIAGQVVAAGPAREVLGQAALLHRAGIEPPQLIRLAAALGLSGAPLVIEEFVTELAHRPLQGG